MSVTRLYGYSQGSRSDSLAVKRESTGSLSSFTRTTIGRENRERGLGRNRTQEACISNQLQTATSSSGRWFHLSFSGRNCPICQDRVDESTLVPIYSRGSLGSWNQERKGEMAGLLIPPRPHACQRRRVNFAPPQS